MPDSHEDTAPRLRADAIPPAHIPPGGYGETMPPPVLGSCGEPLVEGAPDLRGLWRVVVLDGVPEHPLIGHLPRVEQCGNRLVVTAGGVIDDMRCRGLPISATAAVSAGGGALDW